MSCLQPVLDRGKKFFGAFSVTENRMIAALLYCLKNRRRRREVHIGNPERREISTPKQAFVIVPFIGAGLASLNALVEIEI